MINLSKKQLAIMIGIGAIIIFVIGYYIYKISIPKESYEQLDIVSENAKEQNKENVENNSEEIDQIVIHIAGEVKNPGIVKIKEGARIADVIEQAGGLTEQANITNINLAYVIEDGQKITIPTKEQDIQEYIANDSGEGIVEENQKTNTTSKNTTVNINKASKEELRTLQGIGESTAQKIIDYREQNGNFKQIEDIKNVPGIGDSKFEAIKGSIKVK